MSEPARNDRYVLLRGAAMPARKLRPGQRLRVGRHGSNDIVVNEAMVSRFHALIIWPAEDPHPHVLDNKSANQVLSVNGVDVPTEGRHPLADGSRLRIGTCELSVEVCREEAPTLPADLFESSDLVLASQRGPDLQGALTLPGALHRILLDLEQGHRTGTLKLTFDDAPDAEVTFCEGRIVTGRMGDVYELPALEALVRCGSDGTFRFSHAFRPSDVFLDLSVRALINSHSPSLTRETSRLTKVSPPPSDGEPEERLEIGRISGLFLGDQLGSILQMLTLDRRTGTLEVLGSAGRGALFLQEGQLVGARSAGGTTQLEAARAILRVPTGAFKFRPRLPSDGRQFEPRPLMPLVLDAARERDERAAQA